MQSIGKQQ